ncbi:FAD/NAD(P)-binding domain-containing protein [Macrolepiota fuliginosa MF-IS2]|uniref:FAD/NAD(P)-binding domain-containing protein n=1 Tax=Macrolepiota fuliginosa MF-IS2 TaxID=1400762 RepID=A0A9P5XGC9_9AGAR|nr:FAD/NAD(P)-binding domain-containing protein [Macrolepiota fuliginosa MF-IS2]
MESPSSTGPGPSIRVLIVGGNVGGLTTAIAFRRAGHEAFVFEARDEIAPEITGGTRLPPNITKVLYHWGYEARLREVALLSTAIDIRLLGTGERLGRHVWEDELIRDARGNFVFTHHGDFIHFLHDIANELGAKLRYGARVVEVDVEGKSVTLETGEVIKGDIIVGADGADGISRPLFDSEEDDEPLVNVYSTTIPEEVIRSDPVTAELYDTHQKGLNAAWFGDGVAALGWPLKRSEYALVVYGPPVGDTTGWTRQGGKEQMLQLLEQAEPRLRKLGEWARDPHIVTVNRCTPLDDWYHVDGPLALVGHAAQPIAAGSVQEAAIAFEDAVALGRIFSRLKRRDQIPIFLEAYEDVRRERDIKAYHKEVGDIEFQLLPDEYAEVRNSIMREKGKGGRNLFEVNVPTDNGVSDGWEEWKGMVDQFSYNAEDAADDWWHSQGKVMEASKGGAVDGPILQIVIAQNTKEN